MAGSFYAPGTSHPLPVTLLLFSVQIRKVGIRKFIKSLQHQSPVANSFTILYPWFTNKLVNKLSNQSNFLEYGTLLMAYNTNLQSFLIWGTWTGSAHSLSPRNMESIGYTCLIFFQGDVQPLSSHYQEITLWVYISKMIVNSTGLKKSTGIKAVQHI